MPIYLEYAPFYDGSGQIRFALLMSQYLAEVLERHPVAGRRALDLACGTGTLALMLADTGWQVTGLDSSEEMLAMARAKAEYAEAPHNATFVRGDMRRLGAGYDRRSAADRDPSAPVGEGLSSLALRPASFDLVTCVYDSLNYLLSEEDLGACFGAAARALAPGGLLFADMNTRYFLEHDWGLCEVAEQPGFVQVSQSYFDPVMACSTMVLTGFCGDDRHGYRRFDETHVERAYESQVVAGLIAAAGLRVEAAYECFTFQPVAERTQRIAWVARKPEGVTG